jgi:DNA-binding MarR family transcriptional regulator
MRRARDEVLGDNLFSDPAWDILLELYAAKLGGRSMSAPELASATQTPFSTTARWIAALKDRGLVESIVDPVDAARLCVSLSAEGSSQMEHITNHWASAFVSIQG